MDEPGNFNRLVSELDLGERSKLLEKLSSQSDMASSMLYEDSKDQGEFNKETQYQVLPWYYKLWFRIAGVFSSKPPLKLFEDHLMGRLYRDLEDKAPGFYNPHRDVLLYRLQEELSKLRDGSRFFFNALDASFNRDRGGLFVFLGSLEMPEIHKHIVSGTDPVKMTEHNNDLSDVELRQKAVKAMEEAMGGITDEGRSKMYRSAQSLYCLKQLASFHFDRLIGAFVYDAASQGHICPSATVRDQLVALSHILVSLKSPPPMSLLESLFIFVLMEKGDTPGLDIQNEMRKLLIQAEHAINSIRDFNQEAPLTKLIRCITKDPSFSPRNIGGGEDWFALYKERWKTQVEENFHEFNKTRRQRELQNSFSRFFKGSDLRLLENMESEENPNGLSIKGNYCLSFLLTFYSVVFMAEINKHIRPILIEGEFIQKENRTEFTEAYNHLIKLDDRIVRFDQNISPFGDYGKRYAQAKNDMSSLPIKRRKIQLVLEDVVNESEQIIGKSKEAMDGMIKILGGILNKSPDGKYDTLSNIVVMSGKGTTFQDGLTESIHQFTKALQILNEIEMMEAGH